MNWCIGPHIINCIVKSIEVGWDHQKNWGILYCWVLLKCSYFYKPVIKIKGFATVFKLNNTLLKLSVYEQPITKSKLFKFVVSVVNHLHCVLSIQKLIK